MSNATIAEFVPDIEKHGDENETSNLIAVADEAAPKTQIIAIYGKGGIGKSFTLANLSYMMAQQGKKVLLIGCDPKSDTTSLLFGGKACPTIIETASRKKAAGETTAIGDVCFKRDGVYAMELGGPEVGPAVADDNGMPLLVVALVQLLHVVRGVDPRHDGTPPDGQGGGGLNGWGGFRGGRVVVHRQSAVDRGGADLRQVGFSPR